MTQKQLSSELRELMGQLSERAIHQEVSMAQQEQELIVRSERYTIDLPTKRSKRSTSGRSTSAGKTLDESSRDKVARARQSFVTQDSKSTLENPPASGLPRAGYKTPGE